MQVIPGPNALAAPYSPFLTKKRSFCCSSSGLRECKTVGVVVPAIEALGGVVATGVISSVKPEWTLYFFGGTILVVAVTALFFYIVKRNLERAEIKAEPLAYDNANARTDRSETVL